jgi:ATP-binding cassette subfamily F protein uup
MAPPLLLLQDIRLIIGAYPLLAGAELSVSAGERLCLVGRNGSGKSTLMKIAAGLIEAEGGTRFLQPGTTIRYLPQEPDLAGFPTALAYVEAGLGPADDAYRARYLLEQLGMTGEEDPKTLSGGEARRCALARALAPEPDILLLDEPTNHLDLPAIEWLEAELTSMRSALVLISHDRRFLQNLSRATVWLDRGVTRRREIGFGQFEAWRDEVLENEETERHKLDRKIVMEEDWVRYGVSGRRKRNQGRLAKLNEMRVDKREHRSAVGVARITVAEGDVSSRQVIKAEGLSKSYGDREIVKDFSIRVLRGDRIGVIGANGAGKTTLLNLLTGQLEPDKGWVKLGQTLEMATLDQSRASLDPNGTLSDALTGGRGDMVQVDGKPRHVIGYMKDFLFLPEQAKTPVSRLSGGERGRLTLACALAKPSSLLVLDEPTNDLDFETLDLLQEVISDYSGTVLVVSHDRDFLDRVATSVIMSEGEGSWVEYAGGYTDMVAQRGAGVAARVASIPTAAKAAAKPATKETGDRAPEKARPPKLTFKDQHALKTLPGEIDALQKKIEKLRAILADAGLYARDRAAFDKAGAELPAAEAALADAEEKWLTLEMMREEAEGRA